MSLGFDIGRILGQYNGATSSQYPEQVEQDFDHIAQHAQHEDMRDGLAEAFRSDQTPPFGHMVGQLFGQADTHQRTGMLNQLLGAVGPSVLASVLGGGRGMGGMSGMSGMGALAGLLNQGGGDDQRVELTPEQVQNLSPEQVQELAARAEQENPGIIEKMSGFYAQNPQLVKALGGAALAIALGRMSQRNRY
ncbi:MAG TPA: hypothetical protein VGU61_12310 [Noviherbaspirillum sp.]|jgi:hypothetical protein|uniref:hypothetical protein n=1 Tax=Noviherbaspirillum sp. TaxID=1926288 RepID=UPI002DDD32C0|nr:hypothetical protein [Noviherbaspirillum sp.]HEV2611043.1 hypothetical protein [Noviherbaspirillum sp.]